MATRSIEVKSARDLGLALRLMREANSTTREDLAEELDTSPKYLWEVESGKRRIFLTVVLRFLKINGAKMTITFEDED